MASPFDFLGQLAGPGGFVPPERQMLPPPVPGSPMTAAPLGGVDLNASLAHNALMPHPHKEGGGFLGGFKNVLGILGDALLVQSGRAPIYGPSKQRKKMGQALQNYLGNTDSALAAIFEQDPETGLALYKMQHQQPDVPGFAKEADWYRRNGRPDLAEQLIRRHAEGPPLVGRNEDGTWSIIPQSMLNGGQPQGPSNDGPKPGAVEEGYRFKGGNPADPNSWEPVNGGPTASPSGGFLGR